MIEHSTYYKTFSNILTIRTITAEYMIAMKLMAGRKYKNDLSDIIGVLNIMKKPARLSRWHKSKKLLKRYMVGGLLFLQSSVEFIEQTLKKNYIEAFEKIRGSEKMNSAVLRAFEADYPRHTIRK